MRILITGVTGFLGSHIAEVLLTSNHTLLCTRRTTSLCENFSFFSNLGWVNTDTKGWQQQVIQFAPEVIIHSAWIGVGSANRDDWATQLKNIQFVLDILEVLKQVKVQKIIALGSQAEYGVFDGKINEEYRVSPVTAYGSVKLSVLEVLRTLASRHSTAWYWLRVFSVFGERESDGWLIPSVIIRLLKGEQEMSFTGGDQQYAYLYVRDFAQAVKKIVESDRDNSGIYNISADHAIALKEILQKLKERINPNFKLNLGALPYRPFQSMHIEGDISKYRHVFGEIDTSGFDEKLETTIHYYQNKYKHEII